MKRLLSLSLVVASLFGFGLNANAQSNQPITTALISNSEYSQEQIIIYFSTDPKSDPIIKTFLSSYYEQIPNDILALLFAEPPRPIIGETKLLEPKQQTDEPSLQHGGASGAGTTNNAGTATGSGNGITVPELPQKQNASQTKTVDTPPPSPTTLKITSLYPNTNGNDAEEEFIIISNTGDKDVNLKNWSLKDASDKTFVFENDVLLAPGFQTEIRRERTNIALNNDKDAVYLFAPNNSLIDFVEYENSKNGEVYKWANGVWSWPSEVQEDEHSTIQTVQISTPASANNEPAEQLNTPAIAQTSGQEKVEKAKEAGEVKEAEQKTNEQVENIQSENKTQVEVTKNTTTIQLAKTYPDQTNVTVGGIVNVLPGALGKQFFYIQDEESGIQIYKNDAIFPDVTIGQKVIVNGEMSTNNSERRIKVTKNGFIKTETENIVLNPNSAALSELKTENVGMLFTVSGIVNEKTDDKLIIEKDGQTLEVSIASYTGIDTTEISPNASVQVTGVARISANGIRLSPRTQNDLVVLTNVDEPLVIGSSDNGKNTRDKNDQTTALALAAGSGLVMIAFVIRHLIRKQKINYAIEQPVELSTENVH
jgi:uncharacterized protein YdeI (BOF family)